MLKEIECPIEKRVLPIIAIGTEDVLPSKESIEKWINDNTKFNSEPIKNFYKWKKSDNEIIAYCGYGYCDTSIPKIYNCLFDIDKPNQPIEVHAEVKFSIWNGLIPIDTIDHGHKTICIISFDKEVPKILNQVPNWTDFKKGNYRYNKFGLCNKQHYEQVIKNFG
tara:strand:- start:4 stop:498 length:495 start_codon:yes stop_codon:yes gene_type:complete